MSATVLVILAGVLVAGPTFAKLAANIIDTVGIVADKGRQVTGTGPIAVTAGERTGEGNRTLVIITQRV